MTARRFRAVLVLLATLFALVAAVAYASPSPLPRATSDRPDDATGPQIHVVYAVPADGEDRHLDDNGTIEGSVSSSQLWLARETGGKAPRMDTYQGALDITFTRLSKTEAELAARDRFVREGIEEQLKAMGFTAQNKMYAVYWSTSWFTRSCTGSASPPLAHRITTAPGT